MKKWIFKVNPNCSEVKRFREKLYDDPYSAYCPGDILAEIRRDWERRHLSKCKECRDYACANTGIE